jgi:hypothetical protein
VCPDILFVFRSIGFILVTFFVVSCGGGGGGSSSGSTTTSSGIFLDAEVEGLTYTTDSGITGQTDENGTYEYVPGEQITFSIGGVTIGTVDGAPSCTPFDFGAASTNIARFIQSLDADGDPSNGIDITDASLALAGTTIGSDAFLVDTATYEANPDISGAITTAGGTDVGEAAALANLAAGTDDTFDVAELEDNLFVVIVPAEGDIGIISFDSIIDGAEAFSIFASDTTAAGESGFGADATWSIDGSGDLILVDTVDGISTTIKRIGGSTKSISITYQEQGDAGVFPATLLIPDSVSAADLGGDNNPFASKTYDVVDSDGSTLTITFSSNGTYALANDPETGTFEEDSSGAIVITETGFENEPTFVVFINGYINTIDETVSILILGAEVIGGTPSDPELIFNDIGVGSITLKSTTSAP